MIPSAFTRSRNAWTPSSAINRAVGPNRLSMNARVAGNCSSPSATSSLSTMGVSAKRTTQNPAEVERFRARWGRFVDRDPYYNVNLARDRLDFAERVSGVP